MIWLFALGIIGYCLVHEGFRKVTLQLLCGAGVITGLYLIAVAIHHA